MALTVTTVNGGQARVVLGANGRPAHVGELGPLYIRIDLAGFEETTVFPVGHSAPAEFLDAALRGHALARRRAQFQAGLRLPGRSMIGVP